jgi:hypothetical protein
MIREQGFKVRGITISEAWLNILLQVPGRILQGIMEMDPRARVGFRSQNKLWKFLKFFKKRTAPCLLSADLETATDTFEFPVIKRMWQSFFATLNIDEFHPCRALEELFWIGRQISYSFGTFESQRGSLMGEPQSFCTLTLGSLCFMEFTESIQNVSRPLNSMILSQAAVCCGDDVLTVVNDPTAAVKYTKFISDLGMIPSKGKHVVSRLGGVLAEDYIIRRSNGQLEFLDLLKPRLLVPTAKLASQDERAPFVGKSAALGTQIGYASNQFCLVPGLALTGKIIYQYNFRRDIEFFLMREVLLPIELPVSLGGLSAPGRDLETIIFEFPGLLDDIVSSLTGPFSEAFSFIWSGRSIHSHGVDVDLDIKRILDLVNSNEVSSLSELDSLEDLSMILPDTLYSREEAFSLLERLELIPEDLFGQEPDFQQKIRLLGTEFGLVSLGAILDRSARLKAFHSLLTEPRQGRDFLKLGPIRSKLRRLVLRPKDKHRRRPVCLPDSWYRLCLMISEVNTKYFMLTSLEFDADVATASTALQLNFHPMGGL